MILDSVKICIMGSVSTGKSIILNMILGGDYSPSEKKRTTRGPQIYRENKFESLIYSFDINIQAIKEINYAKNEEFLKKMNEGHKLEISDIQPVVHEIDLIDRFLDRTKMNGNTYLELYDIPGLNDSISKDIFFQWTRENFSKFDIVVFVTDLDKGLNNSDEMDILNLITECIKIESAKGKTISIIPIINKCDNVRYDKEKNEMTFKSEEDDSSSDDENYDFEEDENEDKEAYNRANTIFQLKMKELKNVEISSHTKLIPLSAELALIYNMIWECIDNEKGIKISSQYLNALGEYECGKKIWKSYTKKEKVETINEIVGKLLKKKKENDSLYNTGYYYLRDIMQTIIERNEGAYAYNSIINSLKYEYIKNINTFLDDVNNMYYKQYHIVKSYKVEFGLEPINIYFIQLNDYFKKQEYEIFELVIDKKDMRLKEMPICDYITVKEIILNKLYNCSRISRTFKLFPNNINQNIMNLVNKYERFLIDKYTKLTDMFLLKHKWNNKYHNDLYVCSCIDVTLYKFPYEQFLKRMMSISSQEYCDFFKTMNIESNNLISHLRYLKINKYHHHVTNIFLKYMQSKLDLIQNNDLIISNKQKIDYFYNLKKYLLKYRMTKQSSYFFIVDEFINNNIHNISCKYIDDILLKINKSHEWVPPSDDIDISVESYFIMRIFN